MNTSNKLPRTKDRAPTRASKPAPSRRERWQNLQSTLDQALNHWNEITEKTRGQKSPDEQRLDEVKGLLESLKSKLDQF